jgi:vacuolar protein sorting-associated protein 45
LEQELVLAAHQDDFFSSNLYTNFGDLGIKVKELVDDYQVKHKSHQHIESIGEEINN